MTRNLSEIGTSYNSQEQPGTITFGYEGENSVEDVTHKLKQFFKNDNILNSNNNKNLNDNFVNNNAATTSTFQKPTMSSSNLNSSVLSKFSADTEELLQWLNINHPSIAKKFEDDYIHIFSEKMLSPPNHNVSHLPSETSTNTHHCDTNNNNLKQTVDLLNFLPLEAPTPNRITASVHRLLENYADLDEQSRKKLHDLAWNTSDEAFKPQVFTLAHAQEDITNLAKLTKDSIKLADTSKVPILKYDSKIYTVTCMFHQTVRVMKSGAFGAITLYDDPNHIGNKALYMFVSSQVDFHFRQVISRYDQFGGKALDLLQAQCAHISFEDTHHFHHVFTDLCIGYEETITRFLH
jgi:hypothetical protein